ncbi:hypothetical protein FVE85_0403 [Porphyridium purpureum]|uniref:Uncharacterized protein n=1 Tax=Porphyridium purpureum TaxID=35688 RepID=A0A5J4Z181_PORPP|nr:hypothetical protein FVE85_0403 [Porphyridium purpureum]|eukprot:POR8688..scf208_2
MSTLRNLRRKWKPASVTCVLCSSGEPLVGGAQFPSFTPRIIRFFSEQAVVEEHQQLNVTVLGTEENLVESATCHEPQSLGAPRDSERNGQQLPLDSCSAIPCRDSHAASALEAAIRISLQHVHGLTERREASNKSRTQIPTVRYEMSDFDQNKLSPPWEQQAQRPSSRQTISECVPYSMADFDPATMTPPWESEPDGDKLRTMSNRPASGEVEYLLSENGLKFRSGSDSQQLVVKNCPFCHPIKGMPDNQYKLNIHREKGVFFCFRCGAAGNWASLCRQLAS